MGGEQETGMKDKHYDIVSALYQGAATRTRYIQNAEREGEQEIVQFFHDAQDHNRRLAEKATNLLASRVH